MKLRSIERGPSDFALAATLVALVVVAYTPVLNCGYVWDDGDHITKNLALRSWEGLRDIWVKPGTTMQYYPLSFTGFWVGYQLWGLNPIGYHLVTLLFHSMVAVLLWKVLDTLRVRGAWLAGAIFGLHPVNVMSVAWVTELKNTLSGVLVLLSGWAFLRFAGMGRYQNEGVSRDWRFGLLAVFIFQVAMFAKTAVSFLPLTLFLILWWQRGRLRWADAWPLLAMLTISLAMGQLTFHIERLHGAIGDEFRMGFIDRVLVSGRSFWFYILKFLFPHSLTFIYPRWVIDATDWRQYLYPIATAGLLIGLWCVRKRAGKGMFVAGMHFYVTTSFLVLIQVLYMMRYSFVTDHWQYYGLMGMAALAASGITWVLNKMPDRSGLPGILTVGLLLATLGILTWRQARIYQNEETLWRDTLAKNPGAWLAHNNLGSILLNRGDVHQAMTAFERTLQLHPGYAEGHANLANALCDIGKIEEAIPHYQDALREMPEHPGFNNAYGAALMRLGRTEAAVEHFRAAFRAPPAEAAMAHNNLGSALVVLGQDDAAIQEFLEALRLDPNRANTRTSYADLIAKRGMAREAIEQYRRVLKQVPNYGPAHKGLADVLTRDGNRADAKWHYFAALQSNFNSADVHCQLGLILASEGDKAAAVLHLRDAVRLNPNSVEALNALAWLLATASETGLRSGEEAVRLSEHAARLTGFKNGSVLDTLSAAYAESGRFDQAVATAGRAVELANATGDSRLATNITARLHRYKEGQPYRE